MDLLLDTHVFLWWDSDEPHLGAAARTAIADPANRIHVSAASIWEVAIKRAKGKLSFLGSPSEAVGRNGFEPLSIAAAHAETAANLDWGHADPFDRMLVAQALNRSLILVHADAKIAEFPTVPQLWAC